MTTTTPTVPPTTPATIPGARRARRRTVVRCALGLLALAPVPLVIAFVHAVVVHATAPAGGGG